MKTLRLGIIGGGLMGREMASAIGRWCALTDMPVRLELTAVCDLVEKVREWFRQIPPHEPAADDTESKCFHIGRAL